MSQQPPPPPPDPWKDPEPPVIFNVRFWLGCLRPSMWRRNYSRHDPAHSGGP